MPNTRGTQVETPAFAEPASAPSGLPGLPIGEQPDNTRANVLQRLSDAAGGFADRSAQTEGRNAGAVAGLDPNWRPAGTPTLRGEAYDAAAQDSYVNTLQVQSRQAIADAYQAYQAQPVDKQDPTAFKKQLDGLQAQFEQQHVFPAILPSFRQQWANHAFVYAQKAQDDNDAQVRDAAKASFIANQQSTSDSAMRAASLATGPGDALAQQEAEAHNRLVDAQVNGGNLTAVAAQKLKSDFRQSLSQTALMAKFDKLDPAGQAAYLDTFQKSYGTGSPAAGDYYGRLAQIESGGDPKARNAKSGALGPYQFTPETAARYDLADPTDPDAALAAVKRLTADNRQTLAAHLGRAPTDGELYLAHQQGAGGAAALLADPTGNAVQVLAKAYAGRPDPTGRARAAIAANGGDSNGTAGQFASLWTDRFDRTAGPTRGLTDGTYDTVRGLMAAQVRKNASASALLSRQAGADIASVQTRMENEESVPPDQWNMVLAKYGTSDDPDVRQQLDAAGAVRAALTAFKGQSPQGVEAAITGLQADIGDKVPTDAQAAVLKSSLAYLKTYRSDLKHDPLGRAVRQGLIPPVDAIDFSKPDQAMPALAQRATVAQHAADAFGQATTYLLPDEKAQLTRLAAEGGAPMIDAARVTTQALGPDAYRLFEEAGGQAPAFATAGRIASWGGSPAFLADFAERQKMARDPSMNKQLELPGEAATDPRAVDTYGTALAAVPQMNAASRLAARQVFEVRSLRDNLDRKLGDDASQASYDRALQEAAGATFEGTQQYGGVAPYKPPSWSHFSSSDQKVLAPLDMKADRLPDAVGALTDADLAALPHPPVGGDGATAVTARQVGASYLTSVGHGRYALSMGDPKGDDPRWVMQRDGGRFTLDLPAMEPLLRQRVPDAYRAVR